MATAAGLRLVPRALRNPGITTSYGVDQLIMAAFEVGARKILVGCGDSGTCDGGAGALQALGARVRTTLGEVGSGGAAFAEVDSIDLTGLDLRTVPGSGASRGLGAGTGAPRRHPPGRNYREIRDAAADTAVRLAIRRTGNDLQAAARRLGVTDRMVQKWYANGRTPAAT